jgi:hypothetical protein
MQRFENLLEPFSPHLLSLRLSSSPGSLQVAIQAFFDESGRICPGSHVAFGGCAAHHEAWPVITREWLTILKPYGIDSVSMKDAIRFENSFAGWRCRVNERDDLLCELVRVAMKNIELTTAFCMPADVFSAFSDEQKKAYGSPIYCGFACIMQQLVERTASLGVDESIQICCDNSQKYAVKCLQLYHQLRQDNKEFKRRCRSISFSEDQNFTGLQLADIFIYCVRSLEWSGSSPDPLVRKLMSIFEPHGYKVDDYICGSDSSLTSGTFVRRERIITA